MFGEDKANNNLFVCLAKPELLAASITGHGPCLNIVLSSTKVTFLEGAQPVDPREKEEEDESNAGGSESDATE